MYEKILVPTDGSPEGERAVEEAIELATLTGGRVLALYVVDTRDYNTLPESKWAMLSDELESEGETAVEAVAERAGEAGVEIETAVERGVPHEAILEFAESAGADVIVMATHGRSGVERFLMGSVTERVVRQAAVPVLVVHVADGVAERDAEE